MPQRKQEQLNTLASLSALINSSLDPREVRRQAIAAATSLLAAEAGSLFLLDEERNELFFEIALGDKGDAVQDLRLKKGEGIAGWVVEHGSPLMVADVRNDARFCGLMDEQSRFVTRNLVCVPVLAKGKVIGALEAVNRREGSFTGDDLEVLGILADQVAIALENARLYEENLRHLSAIITQERRHLREKERLVKDLHDGIGGIAANIGLLAEIALRNDEHEGMQSSLATIAELSRELVEELRGFMNTLESRELTWKELAAEIRRHGSTMFSSHDIELSFNVDLHSPEGEISILFYLSLLRIAKEAFANVVKHAAARRVEVSLVVAAESCSLTIVDDGRGLSVSGRGGRGLRNMHSRANDLHGTLAIQSSPGTRITLSVPLPFVYDLPGDESS
jgi:signal transduction histidine kinase